MAKKKTKSKFAVFLSKLIDWSTVKRVLWYAGSQALVTGIAVLTDQISSLAHPTTATVMIGILLAQITKAINDSQSK